MGKKLLFIISSGPGLFYEVQLGEGNHRGTRQLFFPSGGALLLLALNLVPLSVPALSENLRLSKERPRQLFLTLIPFCVSPKSEKALS